MHRRIVQAVFFAYIDESGNAGLQGGSRTYVLGCILIEAECWPERFDRLISFRRWLRDEFGVPVRSEIKANYLLQNTGPFTGLGLSEGARFRIYRQSMRLQPKLGFRTFAIVMGAPRRMWHGNTCSSVLSDLRLRVRPTSASFMTRASATRSASGRERLDELAPLAAGMGRASSSCRSPDSWMTRCLATRTSRTSSSSRISLPMPPSGDFIRRHETSADRA